MYMYTVSLDCQLFSSATKTNQEPVTPSCDVIVHGIAVCCGNKDAYYISLTSESLTGVYRRCLPAPPPSLVDCRGNTQCACAWILRIARCYLYYTSLPRVYLHSTCALVPLEPQGQEVPPNDPHLSLTRRLDAVRSILEREADDVTVMAYDIKQHYKALSQVPTISDLNVHFPYV